MIPLLFERAERLLERCIRDSVSAEASLGALEGRSFRVRVDGIGADVLLVAENGRVRVLPGTARPADATVRGTPLDLLRLAGPNVAARLQGSGVTLAGKVHVAEQFAELLAFAMPDPEEELARWIGDIGAYRAGSAAREVAAWAAKALGALRLDTAEYVTEESRLLPTRYESDALFAAVERLRDDVDRAAARLDRLAREARRAVAEATK
jgi:ubiquinone biosynthesis accessory factor UbiJ